MWKIFLFPPASHFSPFFSTLPVEPLPLQPQGFAPLSTKIFPTDYCYELIPSPLLGRERQTGGMNMKFSCEKALLTGAVAVTSRAVAAKSSIPAMEGILIEAGEQLRLTGYNLETGIRATVPGGDPGARLPGAVCPALRRDRPQDADDSEIARLLHPGLHSQYQVRSVRVQHPGYRPGGVPRAARRGTAERPDHRSAHPALHDCPDPLCRQRQ